jgi:hypothetical protein
MLNPLDIVTILEQGMMGLNNSKFFAGAMMLLMNLGARNIALELSEMHEKILNHKFVRRLLVFVLVFYATRDVKVSLIITITFIVLVSGIFHEDSEYCILPTRNVNKNRKITKDEFMSAQEIVAKYQKQNVAPAPQAVVETAHAVASNDAEKNNKTTETVGNMANVGKNSNNANITGL